jgi:hypothetical protein
VSDVRIPDTPGPGEDDNFLYLTMKYATQQGFAVTGRPAATDSTEEKGTHDPSELVGGHRLGQ